MKKVATFLFVLLACSIATCQPISLGDDSELKIGSLQGERIIVRTGTDMIDTVVVMYNYDINISDGENRFTIRHLNTNYTVSFKIPDVYTSGETPFPQPPNYSGGKHLFRINDMRILDGICYFCGVHSITTGNFFYDTNGHMTYETNNEGYVGKFSIHDVLYNINPSFEYTTIPKVWALNRMAVYSFGQGFVSISMLGIPKGALDTAPTCIVDLYQNPTEWRQVIKYSTNSSEILTDIMYSNNRITTVSRIIYDNYSFILRHASTPHILSSPTCLDKAYIYSTLPATPVNYPDLTVTYRYETDPIFLCPSNDNNFFVAHSSSNMNYGTAVYRMKHINDCIAPTNLENQYTFSLYYTELKDIAFSPSKKTFYSLVEKNPGYSTSIQMSTFPMSADYTDFMFSLTGKHHQSFDVLNAPRLVVGGRLLSDNGIFQSNFKLFHYSYPFVFPTMTCIQPSTIPVFILNRIEEVGLGKELKEFVNDKISWDTKNVSVESLTTATICP